MKTKLSIRRSPQDELETNSGRTLHAPYRPVMKTENEQTNERVEPRWHHRHHHLLAPMATLLAALITLSGGVFFQAAATNSQAAATRRSADLTALTSTSSICTGRFPTGHEPVACRDAEDDLRLNP